MESIDNDLYSIVTRIVQDTVRYYRRYSGVVNRIDADGTVWVHSLDYGTDEADPATWLPCRPGNLFLSEIKPRLGDYVVLGFEDGSADTPRYYSLATAHVTLQGGSTEYIYVNGTVQISHDPITGKVTVQNGTQTITLDSTTGKLILQNGPTTKIEMTSSKITISSPQVEINGVNWSTHAHPYLGGGLGDSPQTSGGPI